MKKVLFTFISFSLTTSIVHGYCSDNSYYIESQISSVKNQIANAQVQMWNAGGIVSSNGQNALNSLQNQLSSLETQLSQAKNDYQICLQNEQKQTDLYSLFQKGYDAYNSKNYTDAINYYSQYLNSTDSNDTNYSKAKNNLVLSYSAQGNLYFDKKDYDNAIVYFKNVLNYDSANFIANYNLGLCYSNKKDYSTALAYYTTALKSATSKQDIDDTNALIEKTKLVISNAELVKNAPTNDPLSGYQFYLKDLNIPNAWSKVSNSNQVIVAIIDDGIDINHPDLTNSIWSSPTAKYGSSKIIDFVGDGLLDNLSTGDHGTMIAGIIGASTNNNEGVAGIAKNVKFMPLRVFNTKGSANPDNIIKAMNYAIDNGANVINLSLGGSQFAYTEKYDAVVKRAYDKGVVVVIAAGNGDILSGQQTGVNLTNNPISPVCNNGGKYNKYSIGVMSSDSKGYRTSWTNYGDCVPFMTPGEGIVSTSIAAYNTTYGTNYNIGDGTSFSAPMISGIIALGYNQYGYVSPSIVYDSLTESLVKNGVGNTYVDASKYIDILGTKLKQIKQEQISHNQVISSLNNLNSGSSNGNILSQFGIIKQQDSEENYRYNDFVLRQEVVGMAIKVAGKNLDDGYQCRNTFKDVSNAKPNTWACRAIENSADLGIVSTSNSYFRPEDRITRAEALAMVMRSANLNGDPSVLSSYFSDVSIDWKIKLINKAVDLGIIDKNDSFRPNQNATRGEIFEMAKRVLKAK